MRNLKPTKLNKLLKLFVILSVVTISLIIIFFWTYYSFTNSSYAEFNKEIVAYTKNITEQNELVENLFTGDILNEEDSKTSLPKIRDELLDTLKGLKALNPPKKFESDFTFLKEGLDYNIQVYKQIIAILNRPYSNDLENSLTELSGFTDKCMENYSLIINKSMYIFLPDTTLKYIDAVNSYANKSIIERDSKKLIKEKNIEYAKLIEEINKKFMTVYNKRDYNSLVEKARKEKSNYTDIIILIDEAQSELLPLEEELKSVSIPQDAESLTKLFNGILNNYKLYLQSFKHAVVNEQNSVLTKDTDKKALESLYNDSKEKLNSIDESYERFIKLFSKFKNDNI